MNEKLVCTRSYLAVIGAILQDSSLLDDIDRPLSREDFNTEPFYELLFVAITNLYLSGCKNIDELSIDSYLAPYPEQYKIFQDNNGIDYLQDCRDFADLGNYDYFYHKLRKYSLLRFYESKGYDIKNIYNYTITEEKAIQREQARFDELTEKDIVEYIEKELVVEPSMKYCSNTLTTDVQAAKGGKELIKELMEVPDVGMPLASLALNTICRGGRKGCLYMRSSSSGGGKAIPNDTIIPTPEGYKRVDEIKPGDYLFDRTGKPTKVLMVHPQPEKKQVYKITFSDGREARCCKDHLWTYKIQGHKKCVLKTSTTEEIINRMATLKAKVHIPVNEPVQYTEKEYSVDPYVMGLLLGDGSFRYDKSQKALLYSSEDAILPNSIAQIMGYNVKKNSSKNYSYTFEHKVHYGHHKNVHVEEILKDYPELWQKKSHEKFIPQDYLLGSIEQRFALLRGLLDTDGNVGKKARVSFSTTSTQLKDDFVELCHSLGIITGVIVDKRDKYTSGQAYKITVQTTDEIKLKIFSLPKHLKKLQDYFNENSNRNKKHNRYIRIDSIKPLDEYVEMTCFTVDNEEALFLMNDFIVTHNTRLAAADACKIAVPYYYDIDLDEWRYTGISEPTLYITTEVAIDAIQTILYATVSGVNEEHILYGTYEEGELERVNQAIEYIESSPLYICHIPDFSINDIKNIVKKYHREYSIDYFFFDYIFVSLRLMAEVSNKSKMAGLKEHQLLLVFVTELKTLCEQLGVFMFTSSQLNGEAKDAPVKDERVLSGSKALANKLDVGFIAMPPNNAELKKIEPIMRNLINKPVPNMCFWIYKVRRGKLTRVIVWSYVDLGTMRIHDLFITNTSFQLIDVDLTKIETVDKAIEENSVRISDVKDEPIEELEEEITVKRSFDW